MRLASFNVENMFRRPKALDQVDWNVGKPILLAGSSVSHGLMVALPCSSPSSTCAAPGMRSTRKA